MNSTTILGNIGKLETSYTPSGTPICKFSVASNHRGETTWFNCVCFDKVAVNLSKFKKVGDEILITNARFKTSTYEHEGTTRYHFEFTCNEITFTNGSKK